MTQSKPAMLVVVSAPSGGGKTTLIQALRQKMPELGYSISLTTRAPRSGEQNGTDYFFVTEQEFLQYKDNGDLAEYAQVHGNWYATKRSTIDNSLQKGQSLIFDIDVQGGKSISALYPQSLLIFVAPPSIEILAQRLESRGKDSPQVIARRLQAAEAEINQARGFYKHWIVNDNFDVALKQLCAAVQTEKNRLQI